MRRTRIALLALVCTISHTAFAQGQPTQSSQAAGPTRYCWTDVAVKKRVKTLPVGPSGAIQPDRLDPRRASDPGTGITYVTSDGGETWKNARTGEPADTLPVAPNDIPVAAVPADLADLARVHDPHTGRDFVRAACSAVTHSEDVYVGAELLENVGHVQTTLPFPFPSPNQFDDSGNRHGVGMVAGGNFTLSRHQIVIGPFVSFDRLNQTINHTFPPGTFNGGFLGTATRWDVLVGTKLGVTRGRVTVYGLGAFAWLNQDLTQNNITTIPANLVASSRLTTAGQTVGGGAEIRLRAWHRGRIPLAGFVQYDHTNWHSASLDVLPGLGAGGYGFIRSDETIKVGVDVHVR